MRDFEIVVLGGGIIGCTIACKLLEQRISNSIAIVDKAFAGSGASRRSAGVHFPRGATERIREMTRISQDYYARLHDSDPRLPIYPIPMTVLSADLDETHLRNIYLGEADLVRDEKLADQFCCEAWQVQGAQHANVNELVTALCRDLRSRVTIKEGIHVSAIDQSGGSIVLQTSAGPAITAKCLILAPGPWTNSEPCHGLLEPQGARIKKVVALHIDETPRADDHLLVFEDDDSFLLPLADRGYWLFSYTNTDWDVDPDAIEHGLSEADLSAGREYLRQHAPQFVKHISGGRVFCDSYSADREPIVTAVDGSSHIIFAGAANGSGYRLAPAIADETVELITG